MPPEGETTFYATFESGIRPETDSLASPPRGNAKIVDEGHRGRGLSLPAGTYFVYTLRPGVASSTGGALDLWIRRVPGSRRRSHSIAELRSSAAPPLELRWRTWSERAEVQLRSGDEVVLRAMTFPPHAGWHRVQLAWDRTSLSLWIDGMAIASVPDFGMPRDIEELRLWGTDVVVDEIRLTRRASASPGAGSASAAAVSSRAFEAERSEVRIRYPALPVGAALELRAKPYLADELRSAADPGVPIRIRVAAGQKKWAGGLIASGRLARDVRLRVTELRSAAGDTLPPDAVELRRVIHIPLRRTFNGPAHEVIVAGRFLVPWEPQSLNEQQAHELWVGVTAPPGQSPGEYIGTLEAQFDSEVASLPVRVQVDGLRLDPFGSKRLGLYYLMNARLADSERIARELRDMREHGVRTLVTDLHPRFVRGAGGEFIPEMDLLRRGLDALRRGGWPSGPLVVRSGLGELTQWLDPHEPGAAPQLDDAMIRISKGYAELQRAYPEYALIATHLDEVMGAPELLLDYRRLSRVFRRRSQMPLYVTISTHSREQEALRAALDPWIDVRGHHGYSFDQRVYRGGSFEEYASELEASGDRAWVYHNRNGPHVTPLVTRAINGLYLWASPFEVHVPWVYERARGRAFDDTDGSGSDDGMAFATASGELVSTRSWEAMREGGDDLRYLTTLERVAAEAPREHPCLEPALSFVARLRDLLGQPLRSRELPPRARTGDLVTPLTLGPPRGLERQSPLLYALVERLGPGGLEDIRNTAADHLLCFSR